MADPHWQDRSRSAHVCRLTLHLILATYGVLLALAGTGLWLSLHGEKWLSRDLAEFLWPGTLMIVVAGSVPVSWWMYQVNRQLEQCGSRPTLPAAFAFVGWFLPFANLVIPYLCLNDAMTGMTQQHLVQVDRKGKRKPRLPIVWEVMWVAGLPLLFAQEVLVSTGGDIAEVGAMVQVVAMLWVLATVLVLRLAVGHIMRLDAEVLQASIDAVSAEG